MIVHGSSSPTSSSPSQRVQVQESLRFERFIVNPLTNIQFDTQCICEPKDAAADLRDAIFNSERTRGDDDIVSHFSTHLFKTDLSACCVINEPGYPFFYNRTRGVSRVKNELGHCKIVRDVAQISFGSMLTKRDARAAYRENAGS